MSAHPAAETTTGRRFTWLGVVIGVIALAGIGLVAYLGMNIGPVAIAVGLAAALLPVPILVACFLWLDRYEPEPVAYLAICFGWGAAVATGASLVVNNLAAKTAAAQGISDNVVAVLVAPFIEELTKALGPLVILLLRRREFSGITDGIVYCGLSATGFAMVENILYLGHQGFVSGLEKFGPATGAFWLIVGIFGRIVMSGFAHPLFTSMTGIGLGIAARTADARVRWLAPIAGLLVAMMLHGSWNLMTVLAGATPYAFLYGYVAVMVPIFLTMIGVAVWLRSFEGRLTERTLPRYVRAGWLSPPEVAALGTLGRRYAARRWARRVAGDAGAKAMREYQYAATRLALLRDRLDRGLDRTDGERAASASEEQALLQKIAAHRQLFTGKDPQAPLAVWDGYRYHVLFPDGVQRTLDAPPEPVVPIPVRAPTPVPTSGPAYGGPGYGGPGYGGPGYGGPGYGPPPPSYGPPAAGLPASGPPAVGLPASGPAGPAGPTGPGGAPYR